MISITKYLLICPLSSRISQYYHQLIALLKIKRSLNIVFLTNMAFPENVNNGKVIGYFRI